MSGKSIRDRLPSLPTRPRCDKCNTPMDTDRVWHPRVYEPVPAWVCPADDCGHRMVRGGDHF